MFERLFRFFLHVDSMCCLISRYYGSREQDTYHKHGDDRNCDDSLHINKFYLFGTKLVIEGCYVLKKQYGNSTEMFPGLFQDCKRKDNPLYIGKVCSFI